MKAYIMTTGVIFALLVLAHLLRIAVEGPHLARSPFFIIITIVAGGLCLWASALLILSTRRNT